jgi:hypothetical protein
MNVEVESRIGAQREQEPLAFFLGERRIGVEQILDRWPSAECTYFKLQAEDGAIYILRHALDAENWEMVLFQAPNDGRPDAAQMR